MIFYESKKAISDCSTVSDFTEDASFICEVFKPGESFKSTYSRESLPRNPSRCSDMNPLPWERQCDDDDDERRCDLTRALS